MIKMYTYLYKLFHQIDSISFEREYEKRINDFGVTKIPLEIKPYKVNETYPLFYMNTNELVRKMEMIYQQDKEINELLGNLPAIAHENMINHNLIEEMYQTNMLEGVRSSRKEMLESTKQLSLFPDDDVRFKNMIRTYGKLLSGGFSEIKDIVKVREIYDDLVAEEMVGHHLPDGVIFRKDETEVLKKSGSGKVIHKGLYPEEKVINSMKKLLHFMNEKDDIPYLIRIAISHYYFGFIHPFYDGNGRTSRFISSLYLQQVLHPMTALSLSRACNKHRNDYLEAFEITNSFKNKGELTYFCAVFFDILIDIQRDILNEGKENQMLLEKFLEELPADKLTNEQRNILFVLAQNYFFSMEDKGISQQELGKITNKSSYLLNKETKDLIEEGMIIKHATRPAIFALNEAYFGLLAE